MSDGMVTDKVNINLGGEGGGGGYGASMAALVAALGNRNQGSDNAALIAALGNRNDGHRGDDGFGFGGGGILGLLAILGLLRGRGGIGGGDGSCEAASVSPAHAALLQTLLEGQSDLKAEVPTVALETQNAIQQSIGAFALGTQQAFANLGDKVTNTGTINLQATLAGTKEVLAAICALGAKIDSNTIMDLQRQLGVAQALAAEERNNHRVREVEVNVSQNVNQQQAQAQLQTQIGALLAGFSGLSAQIQRVRADQDIVNLGTMVASGTQATTSTQVR